MKKEALILMQSNFQINMIVKNYSTLGPIAISKKLDISRISVYGVARRLGLKMTPKARGKISRDRLLGIPHTEIRKKNISIANTVYDGPNKCIDCGKSIIRRSSKCQKCSGKDRSGRKSNFWKGGISSIYQIVQYSLYPIWRYPILLRDNFTCQNCGRHDRLEVHHLRFYTKIRDNVMKKNPSLSLKNLDDKQKLAQLIILDHKMEDGITLCRPCHESCHFAKRSELRETLTTSGEDNPQPSRLNVLKLVNRKVQRLTDEDTQPISPTRALRLPLP